MTEVEAGAGVQQGASGAEGFSSPPAAARPAAEEPDVRGRLQELARKLAQARNRRLMLEYLRLRRAVASASVTP